MKDKYNNIFEGIFNKGVLEDKIRHTLQSLVVPKGKHIGTCTDTDTFSFEGYRFHVLRYKYEGALIHRTKLLQSEEGKIYELDLSEEETLNY